MGYTMKRKILRISPQWLTEVLSGHAQFPGTLSSDYPTGSRIVWAEWDGCANLIVLVIENDRFPVIPLGERLPEMIVTFTRTESGI